MLGLCRRYSNSKEEAEDVMMEGFMLIFTTLNTFRKDCSLETWMYRIMVNVAIDHYRKNKKYVMNDSIDNITELDLQGYDNADQIVSKLDAKDLIIIIEQMPEDLRVIFNLHVLEGFSLKEIAERLDKNENTIRVYFRRARLWILKRV